VPPALPGTAQSKRLKESHEFTRLLLGKADMRVVKHQRQQHRGNQPAQPHRQPGKRPAVSSSDSMRAVAMP
jgi:hypothetical protein